MNRRKYQYHVSIRRKSMVKPISVRFLTGFYAANIAAGRKWENTLMCLLLMILLFAGCSQKNDSAYMSDGSAPIASSPLETSVKEQGAEPTSEINDQKVEPMSHDLPWTLPPADSLSYEEYFSIVRSYSSENTSNIHHIHNPGGRGDRLDLQYDGTTLQLIDIQTGEKWWDIISCSGCEWIATDQRFIYGIRDDRELIAVDFFGNNYQVLFTDTTEQLGKLGEIYFLNDGVIFFLAGSGEDIGIYRLYLPEMKCDLLYGDIPADSFMLKLNPPISNVEVDWKLVAPEFLEVYRALIEAPDTDPTFYEIYQGTVSSHAPDPDWRIPEFWWEDTLIGAAEVATKTYSGKWYYYNATNGVLKMTLFGYIYLGLPERTLANIEKNGEEWYLDEWWLTDITGEAKS